MKIIITETQYDKIKVIRRLSEIWNTITNTYPYMYPCDYDSLIIFLMGVRHEIFTVIPLDWFEEVDEDIIWDIVDNVYHNELVNHYLDNCREVGI
jgi:hypothetical protein